MSNRDFKGVWIPKEIWLNKDLSPMDRVLLAEIDSLDNENHCTASNEYFAEFFGVGVATITRSIKKLRYMNLIETEMVSSNTGSYRVIKMIKGSNQNDETGVIKMSINYNSNNNINNNTVLSKDNTVRTQPDEFDFGVTETVTKKSKSNTDEYNDAMLLIQNFTTDPSLLKVLKELLRNRVDMCSKERHHFYASTFKHYLDDLSKISNKTEAVKLSLQYNNTLKVMEPKKSYTSHFVSPDNGNVVQKKFNPETDVLSDTSY